MSQQAISIIEKSEIVDESKLQKVAEALRVTTDAVKSFNEDTAINNFNNFHDNSTVNTLINTQINTVEKVVELYERLLKEKEHLLESQRKTFELLEEKLRNAGKAK